MLSQRCADGEARCQPKIYRLGSFGRLEEQLVALYFIAEVNTNSCATSHLICTNVDIQINVTKVYSRFANYPDLLCMEQTLTCVYELRMQTRPPLHLPALWTSKEIAHMVLCSNMHGKEQIQPDIANGHKRLVRTVSQDLDLLKIHAIFRLTPR